MTEMYRKGFEPPALTPARIVTHPGACYALAGRLWQGCPTIARTPGGRLWAGWYSGGPYEPDEENYNVLVYSDDDGAHFSDPVLAIDSIPEESLRALDIQLWLDPTNRLWVFWTQTRDSAARNPDGRCLRYWDDVFGLWCMTTEDIESDSPRFSAPVRISDGFLRCRPTALKDGRYMMCPYDWAHDRFTYNLSADGGQTWTRHLGARKSAEKPCFDELMAVERRDGGIWMLARTVQGALAQTFSFDGAQTWTPVGLSRIENPSSRFWIDRLPSGRLLLLNHFGFQGRSHMTALLSDDDGETWPYHLLLDERENVSYPDAAVSADGRIFVIYDRGRTTEKEILLACFREEDVLSGELTTPDTYLKRLISKAP